MKREKSNAAIKALIDAMQDDPNPFKNEINSRLDEDFSEVTVREVQDDLATRLAAMLDIANKNKSERT